MSYIGHNNLRLLARNEGKIKSYESCSDLRAWSHDLQVRDKHLREWIKCDMPICVIPISILTSLLRTMTCKSRGRATPRCHPDCKSKILLESICASCHAMKKCLRDNESLSKYFEEEEFETSHWPCERCLEALKSIKMFWKIIIERIFNINMNKQAAFDNCNEYQRVDSVKSLAKVWQNEIIEQAIFIKNVSPLLRRKSNLMQTCDPNTCNASLKDKTSAHTCNLDTNICTNTFTEKSTDTDSLSKSSINKMSMKSAKKLSRCTSVRVKMVDVGCDASSIDKENEELKAYKANIEYLQDNYNRQRDEMERLKQENTSLKIDLQNAYKCCEWKPAFCTPALLSPDNNKALVPKPFDTCVEEAIHVDSMKEIESEMIITMKNCKNENFKHVSLLQVLHKTNEPVPNELNTGGPGNENPIDLLNRVHKTFGDIVRRELSIASDRKHRSKKFDIEATFHKVGSSRSAPSCSSVSGYSGSLLSVSTKDVLSV